MKFFYHPKTENII